MHIGALKKEAGRDYRLVTISIPKPQEPVNENTFRFSLDRERLRQAYRREGRYLLRSNMQATAPETVWENYLLLTRIEQAFKDLKGSLSVRPLWHQLERRELKAICFVAFYQRWPNAYFANLGLFTLTAAHALACQPRRGNH
ncbi:MAG: hypothetical protein BROFUL_00318 [Candidatus Brocadia fulgida]|uniref:Transposase n=1 Tax=Candidatus Brocadia fulgida TaxID=380242 RepID=A0A0M2UZ91_9BACT|nr:MAG: hypothetical protein BROFUL_00318 [Candidatus Brocadia fulgida]